MSQKLKLDDFVRMLNEYPNEDCVVSEEVAEDFAFNLSEAASLSDRELRIGAEYVRDTSRRKKMYVFFRKDQN
tara:strand:+ start:682 stop:900 length:219 start_codon:yes stop_codon:yes gene_type:complete